MYIIRNTSVEGQVSNSQKETYTVIRTLSKLEYQKTKKK